MTIREAAQNVIDTAKDGIGWIAFWKEGKGWKSADFYLDFNQRTLHFDFVYKDDIEALRDIAQKDPQAILVNSYYNNLHVDDGKVSCQDLADALRWQYSLGSCLVKDAIL